MTNETNKSSVAALEIDEPLENIIADECSCVIFECKLSDNSPKSSSYKWYKNGRCIKSKPSTKVTANGLWYRLEIVSTSIEDEGVYLLVLEKNGEKVYSYGNLYVRPIKNSFNNNNEVIYMNPAANNRMVEKHLMHTRLLVGETIELEAMFTEDVIDEYQWYRGNQRILQDDRTIFLNDKKTTTLSILSACETDTDIYYVTSKTKHGIASSFASVVVIDTDIDMMNNGDIVPRIIDPMIDETETNIGEEIRLTCKAIIDNNTTIQWSKKGKGFDEPVKYSEDLVNEIYNNEYISLRFLKPILLDTGEYTVTLTNESTAVTETSSCFLTVNKSPSSSLTPVKVKKPLRSAMTNIGSRVLLACSFDLPDLRYYYVVWYIGHYRVERTTHQFNVFSRGGEFFFFIKQVEPGMAGEVICELHMSLPNRKRVLINKTSSNLVIVPSNLLEQERKCYDSSPELSIYNIQSSLAIPVTNTKPNENGTHKNGSIFTNGKNHDYNDSLFQITCCRLDETCFYFDSCKNDIVKDLRIQENLLDTINVNHLSKSFIIEWNYHSDIKKWYVIEFSQSENDFVKAGVSSLPMFDLKDPPCEQVMNFRIKVVDPINDSSETRVSISPATKELILNKKVVDIRTMEEFASLYTKTGDMIGCGAFGSVVLVKDKNDNFYAAKFLKTRTQKKRETALREFQIMRNLNHSKLVELIDTFVSKEAFVLVMDYLWGGELFDRIVEEEHIKEVDVVPYVKQICEALQYLHDLKIAHLDLKPENIICLSPNSRQVKIIDFGLARVLDDGHETRAIYGTKDYVAPEVLNFEQLTLACDMWSLGVVTYMLLSGVMPFSGDTWVQRSANITRANYNYSEYAFVEISDLAKDFVDRLLVLQPEKRMSSTVALNHQWILEGPPDGAKAGHMRRARENLKSYLANYRARWQRAGNVMIAAHRLRTHLASQRVTPLKTGLEVTQ